METFKEQNNRINLSVNMEDAVESCLECIRVCSSSLQHCLALGGKYADVRHISLLMECSELCKTTTSFMIGTSNFTHDISNVCARVCDATADSCLEIDAEDPHLMRCASTCRECAISCRNLEH